MTPTTIYDWIHTYAAADLWTATELRTNTKLIATPPEMLQKLTPMVQEQYRRHGWHMYAMRIAGKTYIECVRPPPKRKR